MAARTVQVDMEQEPVGIVISRGDRAEATPRFARYMWAPAPEVEAAPTGTTKAA